MHVWYTSLCRVIATQVCSCRIRWQITWLTAWCCARVVTRLVVTVQVTDALNRVQGRRNLLLKQRLTSSAGLWSSVVSAPIYRQTFVATYWPILSSMFLRVRLNLLNLKNVFPDVGSARGSGHKNGAGYRQGKSKHAARFSFTSFHSHLTTMDYFSRRKTNVHSGNMSPFINPETLIVWVSSWRLGKNNAAAATEDNFWVLQPVSLPWPERVIEV